MYHIVEIKKNPKQNTFFRNSVRTLDTPLGVFDRRSLNTRLTISQCILQKYKCKTLRGNITLIEKQLKFLETGRTEQFKYT